MSDAEEHIASPPRPGPPAIRLRGVGKTYRVYDRPSDRLRQMLSFGRRRYHREFRALEGIDLEVGRGETLGIVGRNGSGKSTLLRILCGIVPASEGSVEVEGRIAPLLALGAGFNPDFTGRENVFLNAAILGASTKAIEERYDGIVAFADIGDFIERPVKTYSSGMFARLAFATAISVEPDILVVDEILAVGDELFARRCHARIDELRRRGTTILFVSHSATAILELCDSAILLDHGRLLASGEPKEVIRRYHALLYTGSTKVDAPSPTGSAAPHSAAAQGDADGWFDPALEAHRAVAYPSNGALIDGARIEGADGRVRNRLRTGRRYEVRYEVAFARDVDGLFFGFNLRNVEGVTIGGLAQPPHGEIISAKAGERISVRFPIELRLNPGTYFLSVGVRSRLEEGFLHRLVEAVALVIEPEDRRPRYGYVALDAGEPTIERCAASP
jgi:lipopolysaccharide transport system ATP-binding protein